MPLFETVSAAVAGIGKLYPQNGYVFQDMRGEETTYSYAQVERLTAGRAAAMQQMGLTKGDRIGLVVIEPEDFVLTFLAALRIGVIPVPLYPPMSFGALDAYAERTARVLELSSAKALFASAKLQNVLWGLVDRVATLERLVRVEDLADNVGEPLWPEITPDDVAFLQYTSGSTADPKGVIVTHRCLIANSEAIIVQGLQMQGHGVAVAWLPLYHDMGLIGFVIATTVNGMKSVFLPTMRFIKKPQVWMDALHRHRGTVTFAPNFAYALITKKVKPEEMAQWDLSCVDAFGCGAEPIHPDTAREFMAQFEQHARVKPNSFLPAYGMAEATLAISFKPLRDVHRTRRVDATRFQKDGLVTDPEEGGLVAEHVSCGPAFLDHEMRAMSDNGVLLPEGQEGELCLRGPSVTPGYFNAPEATAHAFRDGWLHTGDLGYILDGEIYVTGRVKDLIILNGRNVHPQAVEWRAGEVPGVRKGNVIAFSRPGRESEELVVVVETKEDAHERVIADVKAAVRDEIGVTPVDVVCLPPGSLPKTSSGKLQRRKARSQYLAGELGQEGSRAMGSGGSTITVARHVARGVFARAKNALLGS